MTFDNFKPGDRVQIIGEGLVGHVGTVIRHSGEFVYVRVDDAHASDEAAAWRSESVYPA